MRTNLSEVISATPAELSVRRKFAAASPADFLDLSRSIERVIRLKTDGRRFWQIARLRGIQTAATAEFRLRRQDRRTARTRKTRLIFAFADDVERPIAAFAAKFHALGEAGVAIGAGDDSGHHARLRRTAAAACAGQRRLAARRFAQRF